MTSKYQVLARIAVDYQGLESATAVDVTLTGMFKALTWNCTFHDQEWCACIKALFDMRLELEVVHNLGRPFFIPLVPELGAWATCTFRYTGEKKNYPLEVVCLDMPTDTPTLGDREPLGWIYPNEGVLAVQLLLFDRIGAVVQDGLKCSSSAHDFKESTYITKLIGDRSMRKEVAVEAWHIMTKGHCSRCAPFHEFNSTVPDDIKASTFSGRRGSK